MSKVKENIKQVEIESVVIDDFNKEKSDEFISTLTPGALFELNNELEEDLRKINYCLQRVSDNLFGIAQRVSNINENKSYLLLGFNDIYELTSSLYNFGKTTTKNYLIIAKKFGDEGDDLIREGYSMTQLVEMSSMEDYSEIKPTMTVREIRSIKRSDKFNEAMNKLNASQEILLISLANEIIQQLGDLFLEVVNDFVENGEVIINCVNDGNITLYCNKHDNEYDITTDPFVKSSWYYFSEAEFKNVVKEIIPEFVRLLNIKITDDIEDKEKIIYDDPILNFENYREREEYLNKKENWELYIELSDIGLNFYKFKNQEFNFIKLVDKKGNECFALLKNGNIELCSYIFVLVDVLRLYKDKKIKDIKKDKEAFN